MSFHDVTWRIEACPGLANLADLFAFVRVIMTRWQIQSDVNGTMLFDTLGSAV